MSFGSIYLAAELNVLKRAQLGDRHINRVRVRKKKTKPRQANKKLAIERKRGEFRKCYKDKLNSLVINLL